MIKSIILSSIFHILIILIVIFNIENSSHKKPKKTKEIKVNIIEEKIPKPKIQKKIKTGNKTKKKKITKEEKPKIKPKPKPKSKPKPKKKKIEKKPEIKKEIPKKTIINKKPPKKKQEPKKIKPKPKKIEKKPEKAKIYNIREYKEVDNIGISGRERSNLKKQITKCYQESRKGFKKFNVNVSVNVEILPNGIIDYNNTIFTNLIELSKVDKKILNKITLSIAKTLKDCSPLRNLPEEKYDIWKKMNIKFKY